MNIDDTLIILLQLANLAMLSLVLSQLSGELHYSSILFFHVSGSIIIISFSSIAWTTRSYYSHNNQENKKAVVSCYKRLIHSRGHNDIADYAQDLEFLESHEDPEFQECTVSAKEQC